MNRRLRITSLLFLSLGLVSSAWSLAPHKTSLTNKLLQKDKRSVEPFIPFEHPILTEDIIKNEDQLDIRSLLVGAVALGTPGVAEAAGGEAIPSALAAYGHYLSLLVMTAAIVAERLTVKPGMSIEEEKFLGAADITVGVAGVALLASGYYRATQYGKGWDFYSHEPLFWFKMASLGVFGGLSLFPTIMIIQRTVKIQQEGSIDPMSEELATRMKKVLNAELSALLVIPLSATLMARGVGYVNDFPTQIVGPAFFAVITAGAVYKYVKDAISWKEPAAPSLMDE